MEWRAGHRRPQTQQRGAVQPQGAGSKTNLLKTGSKEEKGGARVFAHCPSLLSNRATLIRFLTSQGHTQPACFHGMTDRGLSCPVAPMLDGTEAAGGLLAAHLHTGYGQ